MRPKLKHDFIGLLSQRMSRSIAIVLITYHHRNLRNGYRNWLIITLIFNHFLIKPIWPLKTFLQHLEKQQHKPMTEASCSLATLVPKNLHPIDQQVPCSSINPPNTRLKPQPRSMPLDSSGCIPFVTTFLERSLMVS